MLSTFIRMNKTFIRMNNLLESVSFIIDIYKIIPRNNAEINT